MVKNLLIFCRRLFIQSVLKQMKLMALIYSNSATGATAQRGTRWDLTGRTPLPSFPASSHLARPSFHSAGEVPEARPASCHHGLTTPRTFTTFFHDGGASLRRGVASPRLGVAALDGLGRPPRRAGASFGLPLTPPQLGLASVHGLGEIPRLGVAAPDGLGRPPRRAGASFGLSLTPPRLGVASVHGLGEPPRRGGASLDGGGRPPRRMGASFGLPLTPPQLGVASIHGLGAPPRRGSTPPPRPPTPTNDPSASVHGLGVPPNRWGALKNSVPVAFYGPVTAAQPPAPFPSRFWLNTLWQIPGSHGGATPPSALIAVGSGQPRRKSNSPKLNQPRQE